MDEVLETSTAAGTITLRPRRAKIEERGFSFEQILVALWFGLFTGILEGAGLLIFQRVNWQQWANIPHVSAAILWISPLVDVLIFGGVSLILATGAWILHRKSLCLTLRILVFLTIFDFLSLTRRLHYLAILLFAAGATVAFDRWWNRHQEQALRFWKKSCPWLLAVWVLVFAAIEGGSRLLERAKINHLPPPSPSAPNVILIVIDTLRADHLSAYGYARPTTPNIDRIAQQGVLFENAVSACSWTFPSHASLLTGRYPSDHGMYGVESMSWKSRHDTERRSYTTLGEALQSKGYRTAAFSANQVFFTSSVGLGKGFIHFEDYFQTPKDMFLRTFFGQDGLLRLTRALLGFSGSLYSYKKAPEVNREALKWLDGGQQPFFVVLNYFGVHEADSRPWTKVTPAWGRETPVDRYDSALVYADAQIAQLITELDHRGFSRNTIVIITSDHGQGLGQHHIQRHGSDLYLEQVHVPLIIRYPGHVPAGLRIKTPVSNAALAATIMSSVAGTTKPFSGSGLSAFWTNKSGPIDHRNPISELARNDFEDDYDKQEHNLFPTALDGDIKSIVTPQWHLINHRTMGLWLYDWVNDPGELNNLINTPKGQAIAKDLETQMNNTQTP